MEIENTRTTAFVQIVGVCSKWIVAKWLTILLLAFLGSLVLTAQASAGNTGTAAVTAVPADGNARGIELQVQTVDVAIREDAGTVWADTQVWIKLFNPATRTITVPLALPGPRLTPGDLPDDLQVQIQGAPLTMQPTGAGLAAPIAIPAQKPVSLRLTYRQALPESSGLVILAYPLSAADQWANTPESLRVTVRFEVPPAPEQILRQTPPPHESDNQTLTWEWARVRARQDIGLAFMSPAWWTRFKADQAAANAPNAGAAEHIALSLDYQQLAALPKLPFDQTTDFHVRYYPAALAELQAATAVPAEGTQRATIANAHALLAKLYLGQADRLEARAGQAYLQLAAAEAEAALALGTDDPALRVLATDLYGRLAEIARVEGDTVSAKRYLSRVSVLQTAMSAEEQQRSAALTTASQAVARGDLEAARQIIAKNFGPEKAELPGAPPPRAAQVLVTVTMEPGRRTVVLTLADTRHASDVKNILQQARIALEATSRTTVATDTHQLTITLPFTNDLDLTQAQAQLAQALPDTPELALLAAALQPPRISWGAEETPFKLTRRYVERVELGPAWLTWQRLADQLDAASLAPISPDTGDQQLSQIQHALWRADAASWRALAEHSWVEYGVKLGATDGLREWEVPAGAARVLTVEASRWLPERIRWIVAGAALLLVALAAAIWRWG